MDSPWTTPPPHRSPVERPWLGMGMLAAVPLLSLILIRMLWSGSSLWFLTVGILLLGAAAVIFLVRRPREPEPGRAGRAQEASRVPLALAALGVLFLALLLLPNFADGSEDQPTISQQPGLISQVSGIAQPPGAQVQQPPIAQGQPPAAQEQPAAQEEPAAEAPATAGGQTYVIEDGDTLWDIAQRFDTTVEDIVAANDLANPEDLQVGQEIVIPAASEGETEETEPSVSEEPTQ